MRFKHSWVNKAALQVALSHDTYEATPNNWNTEISESTMLLLVTDRNANAIGYRDMLQHNTKK
jgi:hypothetical protein